MRNLIHELVPAVAESYAEFPAIIYKDETIDYASLADSISRFACGLVLAGLKRQQRVAVCLPKRPETVVAIFGTTMAAGVFVPVNPLLKADQVAHILRDCDVRMLVTTSDRLREFQHIVGACPELEIIICVDSDSSASKHLGHCEILSWSSLIENSSQGPLNHVIDADMAAIFYTSGSTGKPKGVVLSHQNIVLGARSVSQYLNNCSDDRILSVLPFSFDYGFSQLTTAFNSGASVILIDYLFPKDVIVAADRYEATGLAGVPPLWIQLAKLPWSETTTRHLRYITNSGGAMPKTVIDALRKKLQETDVFLMYGLTEAFRSTYLDPAEIDRRPDSIGKAIPNAEIMVVREDGSFCDPGEPGELVHRGSLVSLGYWNDTEKTSARFRQAPNHESGLVIPEMAVWSGDTVVADEEGFLYFVGRRDEMIKTSGYRVSPTEVEEAVYATGMVAEVVALGIPHPVIGQSILIVAVISPTSEPEFCRDNILGECRRSLPNYMVPANVDWRDNLPRNANGKIDRKLLYEESKNLFQGEAS